MLADFMMAISEKPIAKLAVADDFYTPNLKDFTDGSTASEEGQGGCEQRKTSHPAATPPTIL